jgi:RNA polymerase sigma-70 factor (ECF subfamily)
LASGTNPSNSERFEAIFAKGRAIWPNLLLDVDTFARYLDDRLEAGAEGRLDDARAADLFLACACAREAGNGGDGREAVAAFLREYEPQIAGAARRHDPSPAFADEVRQRLSDALFVAEKGASPKIAKYSGTGPLYAWVAVAAKRIALRLQRQVAARAGTPYSGILEAVVDQEDPDVELLRARYGLQLEEALAAAFQSLPARQKVVLRLSTVDGVSEKDIGAMYHVHQATVSRWKTQAHEAVLEQTRRYLRERHNIRATEVDSLIRLLHSQVHVTLSRVLAVTESALPGLDRYKVR